MSESIDLRRILESWAFDPENDAKLVRVADGRLVLHVRLPLGLEQYELEGRPDGIRPHGQDSLLDYHEACLAEAKAKGEEDLFELPSDECEELFREGTLYYLRYLRLFQLKEWELTERDTSRNLRLFDFVQRYASHEEDQQYLERWRPYVLRMHAISRAMGELNQLQHAKALAIITQAIAEIETLPELDDETFQFENQRSLAALKDLASQLEQTKPLNDLERLEKELQQAITAQQFEHAAELRDQIRELRKGPSKL